MKWKCLAAVSLLSMSMAFLGCASGSAAVEPVGPGPGLCSPFDGNGELTQWAEVAIKKGIGLQLNPYVTPYPGNVGQTAQERYKPEKQKKHLSKKDRRLADRSARLIGGWAFIESTSPIKFATPEELAQSIYVNDQEHPRYSEALAAVMMLYPKMRLAYLQYR